jgi:hypothetical protein
LKVITQKVEVREAAVVGILSGHNMNKPFFVKKRNRNGNRRGRSEFKTDLSHVFNSSSCVMNLLHRGGAN